ncbi:MAG TPA: hypothetical protein PKI01_03245 [Bacteroidales bacterium]|nr:hypothetical protein [Bacteroidales bacterium]
MKKISFLFVFVFTLFVTSMSTAQNNVAKPGLLDGANAVINGVKGGEVNMDFLTANEILVDKAGYNVESFTLTLKIGEDLVSLTNTGNLLNERQSTLVRKQNPGDKVYIEDIICKDKNGKTYSLPPMTFVIK